MPAATPRADSLASSSPDKTLTLRPVSALTCRMNSGPSLASRTAAVAATNRASGCSASSTALKRLSAAWAALTPSGDSSPVAGRSRPRPASTFSLNTVQIARPSIR